MDISTETQSRHAARAEADHVSSMGRYIYQIRNMVAWMLVIWLVLIAAAVGVGVYLGSHSSSQANGTPNCLSQGGSDTSC